MALTLSSKKTRKIKIKAIEPGDMTATTDHDFVAEFKIIPQDEWKALMDADEIIADVVKTGLIGFEGIKDEDGNSLEFSDEAVDALTDVSWIIGPLFKAQLAIQGGATQSELYRKAKRKN